MDIEEKKEELRKAPKFEKRIGDKKVFEEINKLIERIEENNKNIIKRSTKGFKIK